MTSASSDRGPSWQAEVTRECHYVALPQETPEDEVEATEAGLKKTEEGLKATKEGETEVDFLRVSVSYVEIFLPGDDPIRFRVNRRRGRSLSFTDDRECFTGTAGTTGIWGTLPPAPAGPSRSLTPTAFKRELARFIGRRRPKRSCSPCGTKIFQ
jgi:hypothetical protein